MTAKAERKPRSAARTRGNSSTKEYVAGFLFTRDRREVLLILKTHPEWQAGRYNAIGGKIEEGETPHEAMIREFLEETNLKIIEWDEFTVLSDARGWIVKFFYAASDEIFEACSMTDEVVERFQVEYLPENVIPNLRWLIPMALSMEDESCEKFHILEEAR